MNLRVDKGIFYGLIIGAILNCGWFYYREYTATDILIVLSVNEFFLLGWIGIKYYKYRRARRDIREITTTRYFSFSISREAWQTAQEDTYVHPAIFFVTILFFLVWIVAAKGELWTIFVTTLLMEMFVGVQVFGHCSQASHRRQMGEINERYRELSRELEGRRRERYDRDDDDDDQYGVSSSSSNRSRSMSPANVDQTIAEIDHALEALGYDEPIEKSRSKSESVSTVRMIRV